MTIYFAITAFAGFALGYVISALFSVGGQVDQLNMIDEIFEAEEEISRLQSHVDLMRERFDQIVAQETPGANATVKRMAAIARGGQAK